MNKGAELNGKKDTASTHGKRIEDFLLVSRNPDLLTITKIFALQSCKMSKEIGHYRHFKSMTRYFDN